MFDARIILAGQPADPIGTARSLTDMLQTRQAMEAQRVTLGDLLQRRQQEQALRGIYAQHADDQSGLASALMRGGYAPQALGFMEHSAEVQQRQAAAKKAFEDQMRERAKFIGGVFRGAKDQAGLDAAREALRRAGMSDGQLMQLPSEYNEQTAPLIKRLGDMALSAEKQAQFEATASNAEKGRAFTREENEKSRAAAERRARILAGQKVAEMEAKRAEGRQLPPSMLSELADFDTAEQQVEEIFQKAADEKISGPGAKANKFVTDLLDLQNTDAARFEGASAPVRQGVGTILEKGKLAAGDEPKYKNMLPRYGDSPAVLAEKKKSLKSYLATLKEKRLQALEAGRYAVPGGKSAPKAQSGLTPEEAKELAELEAKYGAKK